MSFFGSLLSPITNLLGGGSKSNQTVNTNVNTSTKQVFSPNNNIDNHVAVNVDIDKLANVLHMNSVAENRLKSDIAEYGYAQAMSIARATNSQNLGIARATNSQALSIANDRNTLLEKLSANKLLQENQINNKNLSLQYAIANETIKDNLSKDEHDKIAKQDDLKLKVLTLEEQKQQNKRITWIALAGLTITASSFLLSKYKKRG